MSTGAEVDVGAAVAVLAAARAPLLIGVRHHSTALARAMPALLAAARPRCVCIELPSDLAAWLPWLGHPGARAPLALAAAAPDGSSLAFMPFADFSPELAAVRWAVAHGVPVHALDLPSDRRHARTDVAAAPAGGMSVADAVAARLGIADQVRVWDRLVEDAALGQDAEALRRAALAVGWSWRQGQPVPERDLVREAWMRARLREIGSDGAVAVVGAFHAAALCAGMEEHPDRPAPDPGPASVTALIPYSFAHLDERSGYPAGVRDPAWHQAVFSAVDTAEREGLVSAMAVAVCRRMRDRGHQASPADGIAVAALADGLARLRNLPVPGRGELVEATESALARGEVLGAGRAVAEALHDVLIGHALGGLPPGCPRSGLEVQCERLLSELGLPGPVDANDDPRDMRLEPRRSELDRLRVVVLERLTLLGVPYGERQADGGGAGGDEALGENWRLRWTHASAASLAVAAVHGATLDQAVAGVLVEGFARISEPTPAELLTTLATAATCGVPELVAQVLERLSGDGFLATAELPVLVAALAQLQRLRLGHAAGSPLVAIERPGMRLVAAVPPPRELDVVLAQAAERLVEGLHGSDRDEDVVALLDLAHWQAQSGEPPGLRLGAQLRRMLVDGSALMQGAAHGLLLLAEDLPAVAVGAAAGSWLAGAGDGEGRRKLRRRIAGLLLSAAPLLTAAVESLDAFHAALAALSDQEFLDRLPALRAGGDAIPATARESLLDAVLERHAPNAPARLSVDPVELARRAAADAAGWAAAQALLPGWSPPGGHADVVASSAPGAHNASPTCIGAIPLADRWRLMLGDPPSAASALAQRAGLTLEACYGGGDGAFSGRRRQRGVGVNKRGGSGDPFPTARAWGDELERLFAADVREEVAAERALAVPAALELIDPVQATPSVALLERILSLKGGLPAGAGERLRQLAKRIVARLAADLARRLRPALGALSVPRPARRGQRLDLRRTVARNLDTAHMSADGWRIVARHPVFRSRARRQLDWHLVLVVDVSGSMEASVIHAALCAAVFTALPALSVSFLAVSTAVVDLSEHVADPLSLLLEVSIGGGTRLGLGLQRARNELRVPSRTMVVLVSDFEEGVSVPALLNEVRVLAASGARLLGLAALDAGGKPRYHAGIAAQVAAAGMPVAALGPEHLARWVADRLR